MSHAPHVTAGRPARPSTPRASHERLLVWLPSAACQERLLAACDDKSVEAIPLHNGVALSCEHAEAVCDVSLKQLTLAEREATRALLQAHTRAPGFEDFAQVITLERAIGELQSHWLRDVLDERRLETWFQPLVSANEPGRIVAHEALLRGTARDGSRIFPDRLFGSARRAAMLFELDLEARCTAVRQAIEKGLVGDLYINFAPASIDDPMHSLRTTLRIMDEVGLDPKRVVFEVTESDRIPSLELLQDILRTYRAEGFRVALDDVGAGYSSLNLLHEIQPDIVKLDMDLVQGAETSLFKQRIAGGLITMARELGITTVAEGVEELPLLHWLQDQQVDLIQGYLIARPEPLPRLNIELPWESVKQAS